MKTLLALLVLGFTINAHAAAPFTLDCQGPSAHLHFEQTANGIAYNIETPQANLQGFKQVYFDDGKTYEETDVSTFVPEYDASLKLFALIIDAGTIEPIPAYDTCLQTRAGDCVPVHVPASTGKVPNLWIDLMLDVAKSTDHPTFMHLDLGKDFLTLPALACDLKSD